MATKIKSLDKVENRIKWIAYSAVAILCGGLFFLSVVLNHFGGKVWDVGVYAYGCIALCAALLLGVRYTDFTSLIAKAKDRTNHKDLYQVGCFAVVTMLTIYYYDSASEVHHQVATYLMDAFFGLALLAMYKKEEWHKKWQQIISALVVVCVFGYLIWYNGTCVGDIHRLLRLWRAYIYIQIGFCVWGRVKEKRFLRKLSVFGYIATLALLGMVIFRNTRLWPFSVAVPFLCLYYYDFKKDGRNQFLRNYAYGTMVAFWLIFGSALLFRPYYSFEFVRYPSWFASCASAGLFWTVVLTGAFSAVFAKYKKGTAQIKDFYWELITFSFVAIHVLMSMARTTFLAIFVFGVVAFILMEAFHYKDKVKEIARKILILVIPVVLLLPAVYTLVRCVPAMVARPFWVSKPEWFSDRIMPGESPASRKYMNAPQFAETFLEKIVGVDINLSYMLGEDSGPGLFTVDENGNTVYQENVIATSEHDGQVYATKDYTFHNDSDGETSNGRFDIFKIYFDRLNLTGHDTMVPDDYDMGETIIYHAHNTFMQVFYDHGIIVGILFLCTVFGAFIKGILYYKRYHDVESFAIYPVIVVISFMTSGMTEWIFHPSIPSGFAFLIVLLALFPKIEKQHEKD